MTDNRKARSGPRRIIINTYNYLFLRYGIDNLIRKFNQNTLTIINYHRINDPYKAGFDTFKPNVSATPEAFNQQLVYLKKRFNLVTARNIIDWMEGCVKLPSNAALITFDDGYLDNLTNAYPLLKEHGLSALVFLTTDFVGKSKPSYWDLAAYCFYHTPKESVQLPIMGITHWKTESEKELAMIQWIERIKTLPDGEKSTLIQRLPGLLNVAIPEGVLSRLFLTWAQVCELIDNGIEIGSHTVSHPILTRISLDQVKTELSESKKLIEKETGQVIEAFAYPNGQESDFNKQIITEVKITGYKLGFTLLNGSNPYTQIRNEPFTLKRIFVNYRDSFQRFTAMVNGLIR